MTHAQQKTIDAYRATGRIVFVYPRLGLVSLNGFKREPIKDAMVKMQACIEREDKA